MGGAFLQSFNVVCASKILCRSYLLRTYWTACLLTYWL